ncbi:MAG: protein kinase [Isosphaeraceae bacterium]
MNRPWTEETIFAEALSRTRPEDRSAFLDVVCQSDATLRARVEALLEATERDDDFLHQPPVEQVTSGEVEGDRALARRLLFQEAAASGGEPPEDHDDPEDWGGLRALLGPSDRSEAVGRLGRHDVLRVLGRGSTGIVLLAIDAGLDRIVALKVLSPVLAASGPARRRFVREARALASISHENVVVVHAVEENHEPPFLVMGFVHGGSLQDRIRRDAPFTTVELLRIGAQAARGLGAAHAVGLIHRDVKPANLLIEEETALVKLSDFGLARAADDTSLTGTGFIAGTPAYMAPEQAAGRPVDHRCDLFALGAVLYACATGKAPFQGDSTVSVLRKVCDEPHVPVIAVNPEAPDWLSAIIDRLLAKNPDDRPDSADELAESLERCLAKVQAGETVTRADAGLAPIPPSPPAPTATGIGPRTWRWAAGVGSSSLLAGAWLLGLTGVLVDPPPKVPLVATSRGQVKEPGPVPAPGAGPRQPAIETSPALEAVVKRLKEANPGFDGRIEPSFTDGEVTGLIVSAEHLTDLSPLQGLPRLSDLTCRGEPSKPAPLASLKGLEGLSLELVDVSMTRVSDLTPLREMRLRTLILRGTSITDVAPLSGMPLSNLNVSATGVSDLRPLVGMPLVNLDAANTPVSDLSPLARLPLRLLNVSSTRVVDLSPLEGLPLDNLNVSHTGIKDLAPLRNLPLTALWLDHTEAADLSPLQGLPLGALTLENTRVTDLSPLAQSKISYLRLDFDPNDARQTEVLRSMPKLVTVNNVAASAFLSQSPRDRPKPSP